MADANIYPSETFIKRLEHTLKKLSATLEQLDIMLYSARQTCRELSHTCSEERIKG